MVAAICLLAGCNGREVGTRKCFFAKAVSYEDLGLKGFGFGAFGVEGLRFWLTVQILSWEFGAFWLA